MQGVKNIIHGIKFYPHLKPTSKEGPVFFKLHMSIPGHMKPKEWAALPNSFHW